MKKSDPIWVFAIIAVFIFLILDIVFNIKISETKKSLNQLNNTNNMIEVNFTKKINLQGNCPDSSGGNYQSYLRIKYFYSDFCPWCVREEPILQRLVSDYGNLFYIGWFNINACYNETERYKVGGVPTFIFSTYGEDKEYSHYGFIYEEDLKKLICDVTGGC